MDINYHIAFSPRRRKPVLVDDVGERLDGLIQEKAEELGVTLLNYQRKADFVYINVEAKPDLSINQIVHAFKVHTARHLRREFFTLRRLPSMWTRKFLASTAKRMTYRDIRDFVETQSKRA